VPIAEIQDGAPSANMTAEVVTGGQIAGYSAEIDALLADTGAPLSARWPSIKVWLRHQPNYEPWAVLVRLGGDLVGAAVLARRASLGCWKIGKPGSAGEQSWLPARDSAAAQQLAMALRRALDDLGRPWFLSVPDLPGSDPVAAAVQRELSVTTLRAGADAPQLCFASGVGLSAYLSRNTRSAVAKAGNRISRAGLRMDVSWVTDPAAVDAVLPEIVQVHRLRNQQLRRTSTLDSPAAAGLFNDFIRTHARNHRVRLLTVRIGPPLASFAVCLLDQRTFWVYANLVSPDWLHYSAGTIANAEVVRAAYLDPAIDGVDWGAGLQRYKLSGAATLRPSQHLAAWSSPALKVGLAVTRSARRSARGG
jgi:CelD/BcsL family acetyltransferase involved in cellulose biosynthesis